MEHTDKPKWKPGFLIHFVNMYRKYENKGFPMIEYGGHSPKYSETLIYQASRGKESGPVIWEAR